MSASANQLNKNKMTQSSKSIVNVADEIRIIKEKLEEEKVQQGSMDEDIKTLQQEIID